MKTIKLIINHKGKLILLIFSLLNALNMIVFLRNLISIFKGPVWIDFINKNKLSYNSLIKKSINWIKYSQDKVASGGVGCYEFYRWTKGYPEVTGYIIPTFINCSKIYNDHNLKLRAFKMADWELSIQKYDGGWEGQYEGDGKPSIIFNTGQVIRGLLAAFKESNDEKYLESAIKAADWIIDNQDNDGSWTAKNFKQMKRVYDTYVTAPLSELFLITKNNKYRESCVKNCDFVLLNQNDNGWFKMADNTLHFNHYPVLHTISYTIDGLIETGLNLKENKYIESAKLAADFLLHKSEIIEMMPARFDKNWKSKSKYSCLTGNAQLGIIFLKLYEIYNDVRYINAALKLADFLAYTQNLNSIGINRIGGITGSYPIWGMYCPFKYPSWAAKYYIDLLILIKKHTDLD